MAKRREAHDEELPFVALMDTMTNVVGVLIIVLVMIGISLASSVKKIFDDLPEVTVEQLEEMMKKVEDLTPKEDPEKVKEEIEKLAIQIKKVNEELKSLDTTTENSKVKFIDLDELNKKIDDNKIVRNKHKEDLEKLILEVDRLKKLLSETPEYVAPEATVVRLPNPREIPKAATFYRFMIVGDRVVYLNEAEYVKAISENIEKQSRALAFPGEIKNTFGEVIMQNGRPKTFLDRKKVEDYFRNRIRLDNRDLKVELVGNVNSSRMNVRLHLNPNGGESVVDITQPGSTFQRAMRKIGSEPNSVVWFYIAKGGIPTYLKARDIADAANAACGWELINNEYYQVGLPSFDVDFVPPAPQPPPPPGAIRIRPPANSLD